MRKEMTEPERRLWKAMRRRLPQDGSHFRRQVSLGPYIADFCCLGERLIVDFDGNQHGLEADLLRDAERDAYLGSQGFRVLRFTNNAVLRELEGVLDTIWAALNGARGEFRATPTPSPSPRGGGGPHCG